MGRVASPPRRPTLVFDGDCGFCRYWILRWIGATGGRVDHVPYQGLEGRFPEIDRGDLEASVHLVEPDGTITSGARAVFTALAVTHPLALRLYRTLPGAAAAAEGAYRLVARRRRLFSALTRLLWGRGAAPPSFVISSRLFLAGLGLVYLTAFVSLAVQVRGLAGREGILPAAPWLEQVASRTGWERFWLLPTLAWIDAGDGALVAMCVAGGIAAVALAAGLAPGLSAAAAWLLYLSLSHATRLFLGFQWDTLLLEAGFLAIFLQPAGWRLRSWRRRPPSPTVRLLLWWLLFRLMFGSGAAKLGGGDPVWRDLTALAFHYETQPLPTWTAWLMHQLPMAFHRASTLVMFVAELALPILIFAPRRPRLLAFWGLAGLQVILIATGNFAFFNWLSLVLCLPLVDDASWPRRLASRFTTLPEVPAAPRPAWRRALAFTLAAAVVIVSGWVQASRSYLVEGIPGPVQEVRRILSPFRSLNAYGLFINMTTERPEIILEGSEDGRSWKAYPFRWKPGDPHRRPAFVAPHQPRLDWQMWFAALGRCRSNPWLVATMQRLVRGSPAVLGLLEEDPFHGRPPRQVRAVLWEYRFSDLRTWRATGAWWVRERKGLYCPVVTRPGPG